MKIKILTFCLILIGFASWAKPIKVMLLTGQTDKYHNWEVTSSYLKATLDHNKIFCTDVVMLPAQDKAFDKFVPEFSKYQVVVLNMNMPEWNEKAKSAFVDYVKNGGGVVFVHEANNAFPQWKAYNEMSALGGWGGRTESQHDVTLRR